MLASRSRREMHVEKLETCLESMCMQAGSRYPSTVLHRTHTLPRNTHFTYPAESERGKENITLILCIFFTV